MTSTTGAGGAEGAVSRGPCGRFPTPVMSTPAGREMAPSWNPIRASSISAAHAPRGPAGHPGKGTPPGAGIAHSLVARHHVIAGRLSSAPVFDLLAGRPRG